MCQSCRRVADTDAQSKLDATRDASLQEAVPHDLSHSVDKKLLVYVSTGEVDAVCALHILKARPLAHFPPLLLALSKSACGALMHALCAANSDWMRFRWNG